MHLPPHRLLAGSAPGQIGDRLRCEIKDLGVAVKLCHPPAIEELKKFDVVLNATGAGSYLSDVHGLTDTVIPFEEVIACPKRGCEFFSETDRKNRKVGKRILIWGDPIADC